MIDKKDQTPEIDEDKKLLDEVIPLMGPPPEELPPRNEMTSEDEGMSLDEVPVAPLPDDSTTSEAVEDIVAEESSQLLEAEDEKLAAAFTDKPPKKTLLSGLRSWWGNRLARRLTIGLLILLILAAMLVPSSRYFILNTAGVRVSANFKIIDDKTEKPLKNVDIALGGASVKTDENGEATLRNLRLGKSNLTIKKRSFAPKDEVVTLGWGSNPFTAYKLTPSGSQYSFQLNDWLSGLPIVKAEVTEGDSSAFSDDKGLATLSLDPGDSQELTITINAKNYRPEGAKVSTGRKEPLLVKLVAEQPDFFMSKRSGKYDLYKIDADSKNEELLLAGTGKERDDIVLSLSPNKKFLALVTTRNGSLNSDGYARQNLSIFEVATRKLTDISESEQERVIGWVGDSVVYVKVQAGASGSDSNRQKLMAYDVVTTNLQDLAGSNNFNDITVQGERIYFAPSNVYGEDPSAAFVSIKIDGTDRQTHLERQTWSILRTSHDSFSLSSIGNKWYSYKLGESKAASMTTPTSTPRDRQYSDSPDAQHSVWVDYRDGKGVIVLWDKATDAETVLYSVGGLSNPLQWLSNEHVVFRVATSIETADYIINIHGGEPQKIVDVANVSNYGGSGLYN